MAFKPILANQKKITTPIDKHCYELIVDHQLQTGAMLSWIVSRALECYFEKLGRYTPGINTDESAQAAMTIEKAFKLMNEDSRINNPAFIDKVNKRIGSKGATLNEFFNIYQEILNESKDSNV